MNRINKFVVGLAICFAFVASFPSCTLYDSLFDGKVVTTQDNVKEEYSETTIPVPEGAIPKEQSDKLKEAGKTPVIVDKIAVKDETKAVDLKGQNSDLLGTVLEVGLDSAKVLFPGVAVIEFLGTLFSQRKRAHYAQAAKALVPYDGKVEVTEAIVSLGRALGLAHSSEASKDSFKKEVEKPQG